MDATGTETDVEAAAEPAPDGTAWSVVLGGLLVGFLILVGFRLRARDGGAR